MMDGFELTSEQQDKLDDLASYYASVGVEPLHDGYARFCCYPVGLPEAANVEPIAEYVVSPEGEWIGGHSRSAA